MTLMNQLFTVGHSNYDIEHFLGLLSEHTIDAVADVRQSPYSKYVPHFNKEAIKKILTKVGIKYVFLGDLLGARPKDINCYTNNRVDFSKLAQTSFFQDGLNRLQRGLIKFRIALMCSEKDPIVCHRTILVCRNLRSDDLQILHILEDASLEDNRDSEIRLRRLHKLQERDLFRTPNDIIEDAYDRQSKKIAASILNEKAEESAFA